MTCAGTEVCRTVDEMLPEDPFGGSSNFLFLL